MLPQCSTLLLLLAAEPLSSSWDVLVIAGHVVASRRDGPPFSVSLKSRCSRDKVGREGEKESPSPLVVCVTSIRSSASSVCSRVQQPGAWIRGDVTSNPHIWLTRWRFK